MSRKNLIEESRRRAREYARRFPSRISDVREILDQVAEETRPGQPDFEVRRALYPLLDRTTGRGSRSEVLRAYREALDEADREGRLGVELVWKVPFEGSKPLDAFVDGARGQIIALAMKGSRSSRSPSGIWAFKIADGSLLWQHTMTARWAPWTACLGPHRSFCSDQYLGESDEHRNSRIYAHSLTDGRLDFTISPKDDWDLRILGLFGDLLIVFNSDGLTAYDSIGQERWRHRVWARRREKLFCPRGDVLCAQSGKREIGWFSQNGRLLKKMALEFPRKDDGQIDLSAAEGSDLYLCAWSLWSHWEHEDGRDFDQATILYAVDLESRRLRWRTPSIPGARFERIIPHGKRVYFSSERLTLAVDRETGETVSELPYKVLHAAGSLIYHSDKENRFSDDPFTFSARYARSGRVRWQRGNFELLLARDGLLFGKVGEYRIAVLDEGTGRERASVEVREPLEVYPVGERGFLVRGREELRLFRLSS